jgi:hypothetical protein
MKKRINIYMQVFLSAALFTVIVTGCKKNKEDISTATSLPAYHIQQSEHLVIPAAIDIPGNTPKGNSRVATYFATGVQKYKAQIKSGSYPPFSYEWVLVAPQANLYDITNKKVGTHSAGPTWQLSEMDSIYGQHFTPAKTVASPDNYSIDWLLLMPRSGKIPTGIFAEVCYIQRIATSGGKAPKQSPTSQDETVEVPYTAVYRFTKKNQ